MIPGEHEAFGCLSWPIHAVLALPNYNDVSTEIRVKKPPKLYDN